MWSLGDLGCLHCPLSEGRSRLGTLEGVRLEAGFCTDKHLVSREGKWRKKLGALPTGPVGACAGFALFKGPTLH